MSLNFIGILKTATKKCTVNYFPRHQLSERGQRISLVRKKEHGNPAMMAVLRLDRQRRYFVSIKSTKLEVTPWKRSMWRQTDGVPSQLYLFVPQPQVFEKYFSACAHGYRSHLSQRAFNEVLATQLIDNRFTE